jgi:carbamoyl-phosphate synthase large subunit
MVRIAMKRVLITGAGGPAAINFIMSLKIAPEKFYLIGTDTSRYNVCLAPTDSTYIVPKATETGYIDAINEITRKEKVEFVHPQPDIEVRVISENRERLEANVFLPAKRAISICQDKLQSAKLWLKKGVPTAKTMELRRELDIEKAFGELGTPLWIRARHGAGGRGSTLASSKETALSWIQYWRSRGEKWGFIAQEYLRGRNFGFHSLWKDGELVTSMARERIKYIYPHLAPSGITGTPAVQRTIHNEKVNEVATRAVLAIDSNYNGIACVDLKENDEGVPCVTEINPGRMFTTSFFFSYASKILYNNYLANIPYLYVKLAYREAVPDAPKYNLLPEELYWIRHIDAPAKLVKDGKVLGAMYTESRG